MKTSNWALVALLIFSLSAQAQDKSIDFSELGFDKKATEANHHEADLLKTRAHKLQRHQLMGYITAALMLGAVMTGPEGEAPEDIHKYLGIAAASSYAYTAYLSLSAPEVSALEGRSGWGMRLHKALVWVHLPGMILTPIAGLMAEEAYEKGKKPTGLGKYKKDIAWTTVGALGLAALSVSFEF